MRKIKNTCFIATFMYICIGLFITAYNYYAPATERPTYTCQQHKDDTLRLVLIGDSWVFFHYPNNDTLVSMIKQKTKKPVKLSAYGLCGKTSKEVYQSIFEDKTMRNILEQGADYCFIAVGINDTYKKMGAKYYALNTIYILRFLLNNNIKPIILEIPDYDINYAYNHQTSDRKLLRQLSMFVTGSELDCRQEYRQALNQKLKEIGIKNKTSILSVPYSAEYYESDRMHLNAKGYQLLDLYMMNIIH